MKKAFYIISIIGFFFVSKVNAQIVNTGDLINWTSSVGQMLFNYHQSYGIALEEIKSKGENNYSPTIYAGGVYGDGWAFSFGEFNEDSIFVLDYGVIVDGKGKIIKFDAFDFERPASAYHNLAAKALLKIKRDFRKLRNENNEFSAKEYQFSILPFPRGEVTGFISPKGLTYFGNDVMYSLDRKTLNIRKRNRFHYKLLEIPKINSDSGLLTALNVPDAPIPSPIDVFKTIQRREKTIVNAKKGVFLIDINGTMIKLAEDDPRSKAFK